MEDKPWKNEELNKLQEALPRLKDFGLEKVSKLHKAKTGAGCDGFHSKVHLNVTKETRGEVVEFFFFGEGRAEWKMSATSMHDDVLLDSEECHE